MRHSDDLLTDGYLGNVTTLRQLQLLAGLSHEQAAALCFVSPETYRRWRSDRSPNPLAVRLMAVMAGYVPWPAWSGWVCQNGCLFPPGYSRHGLSPGDVLAMPFNLQLLGEYRRQLAALSTGSGEAFPLGIAKE